jgi:hypothetical protein
VARPEETISERRFVITTENSGGRNFWILVLVLWGIGYGLVVLAGVASAEG